jgi:hypothetical protein
MGAAAAVAQHEAEPAEKPFLEATHLPPLLTTPAEPVELRYDVYCESDVDSSVNPATPCDATGTVFVRAGDTGLFQPLPVQVDAAAVEGRYVATVPAVIARSQAGFSYYAVFSAEAGSRQAVLPLGGGDAPQRSLPLGDSVDIALGRHVFGKSREPDARVAEAIWGDGSFQVGLEQGRNLTPIGASSFDVDASGRVVLLDEAHERILRWSPGEHLPTRVPLPINGTLADLALAGDRLYVLESTSPSPTSSLLRIFGADGSPLTTGPTAERATQVRAAANDDPVVLQEPSGQWMQAAADGRVLSPAEQAKTGRGGRPLRGGGEVIVLRRGNEIRVALTGNKAARRSWRVRSDDPLAEIQLAEPIGGNVLVVARVYAGNRDEFVVLVLGAKGLIRSFSVRSADWAESSPLSRFRLVGRSLYRLGSTPDCVFVDRYDLEVR